ncbi:CusA/CzcA family heavy metal efflux RND transporter [Spirosoma utsteinense]|uniref:Cobalt-zinc-cadmium resistance protein CzcA n=1 Tax=Spirosoma utsteinense TaxID=2585773 RepID=A0ABR6W911_9BACT|nr:CusA/CzcA family heavy metal efflux RND transporter [Spirosoma utsteinense]MBC3784885.1 cobalt-zinc-cadmium resistance protein CzcA [Spirosoma utsteinense]MBC3792446.1 cobalt-zinc-cadmium resistance protein CzcA [Spirosoma utsteinense]
MFDAIIRFSIRNKLVVGAFVLALIGWGGYSAYYLPVDAVPDITNNQVVVITQTPALAAQEAERFITTPLELAMANLQNVEEIRSVSKLGISVLTVVFTEDTDMLKARQLVSEQLQTAVQTIPADYGRPFLAPITTGLGEIYQYTIVPQPGYEHKYSLTELRTVQDWIVKRQLAGVPGVIEISSFGGYLKQYEVAVDPERLRASGVTLTELADAMARNNANTGGSYIERNSQAYFIRGEGVVGSLKDIENTIIRTRNGLPVRIGNVAAVRFGHAVRFGALTRNGQGEAVGAVVLMLKGADSETTINNVKERIKRIQASLPEGLRVVPFIDRTKLIGKTISTVERNLLEGGLIVVFVLLLLMGNWRAGLIVASVIPLAMLFTLGMMKTLGLSANLMSLGAIDFGLIVDGSIIIVEAVLHHFGQDKKLIGRTLNADEMDEAVFESASAIRRSAAFGEIIILIVYLPILSLTGIEGKMFRPMAETVSFAILAALILSLTYVPMMAALLLPRTVVAKRTVSDRIMDWLYRGYEPMVVWALRWRKTVVLVALGMLAGVVLLFSRLGGEFIPQLDEGDMAIDFRMPSGTSLSATIDATLKAERALQTHFHEIRQVVARVGASEVPTDPMNVEQCDLMMNMKDRSEWTNATDRDDMAAKMADVLEQEVPGSSSEFTQPIQMRFNEMMTGVKSDIVVKIFGDDLQVLFDQATACGRQIEKIPGISSVRVEQTVGLPQINVQYDRAKLAQYGVAVSDVNRLIKAGFAGEITGPVYEGERRYDMVVRLDSAHRQTMGDLSGLYVSLPDGHSIPITEVATIQYVQAPAQISHDGTKRRITIGVNIRGRDVESVVGDIQQRLGAKVKLPPGYYFTYGGAFENLQRAKDRLSVAVPVALFLIFLLLFATFGSLRYALLIFSSIPLAAIGGVLALWLRDMPFSISAGVGFIALFGVAVLNGIVLIGYLNELEKAGEQNLTERIMHGIRVRFRPVIMTAAVASLGFLPMALSTSAGAEVQKPLATVVIGGLFTATLLTLLVLPVLYSLVAGRNKRNTDRPSRVVPTALLVGLMVGAGTVAIGQAPVPTPRLQPAVVGRTGEEIPAPVLSLSQALDLANRQSLLLRGSTLEIESQRALVGSAFDPAKTNVEVQIGQIQARPTDYVLGATQLFAMPSFYRAQKQLYQSAATSAERRLVFRRVQLHTEIKQVYYRLLYDAQVSVLLRRQDSLYQNAARAATVRYKTGETNRLEQVSAETRLQSVQLRQLTLRADIEANTRALQLLVNTSDPIRVDTTLALRRDLTGLEPLADSARLASSPALSVLEQDRTVSRNQTYLERQRLKPDLLLGYYNQSILREAGYNVVPAGVALPLFTQATKARIAAARINEQITDNNLTYSQTQLTGQLAILQRNAETIRASLAYFEQGALPQARLIQSTALRSYRAGEIDYVEFFQAIQQAFVIEEEYLNAVLNYSNLIIQTEQLIGL